MALPGLIGKIAGAKRVQFIQQPTGTILELDCSVKETHSRESPATKFPVEDGTSISDDIILQPISLEIEGIISDTPLNLGQALLTSVATSVLPSVGVIAGAGGLALFNALQGSDSPSVAAFIQILKLQETKQPFDVITTLNRYTNMWIESISVPRDKDTARVIHFTMKLTQLIVVSPQTVNIAKFNNADLSASELNAGKQESGAISAAQRGAIDARAAVAKVTF
jgi:hypothetical protein